MSLGFLLVDMGLASVAKSEGNPWEETTTLGEQQETRSLIAFSCSFSFFMTWFVT